MQMAEKRINKQWECYMEAVDCLIDLLPPEVETTILKYKQDNNISFNNSNEGHAKYHMLLREIKKELNACNIVWHRGSYAVGHD